MKQAEVKVGGMYVARISGALVRVTVLEVIQKMGYVRSGRIMKTAYRVRNERTGREVTKSAAALRPDIKRTVVAPVSYTDPSHRDRYLADRESDKDG